MKPINFQGADGHFGRPKDWNEKESGVCSSLPVMIQELPGGLVGHVSLWVPTPEERAKLIMGSAVMLSCVGLQPVVALGVTDMPAKEIQLPDQTSEITEKPSTTTPLP